jgi:DNA-directed RNA polymerase subunit N (RpoN/RPB10)
MLYPVCPSCNKLLANKQIPYEIGIIKINEIKNNSELSTEKEEKLKKKLLNDLGILSECCIMRVITFSPLIDIIN